MHPWKLTMNTILACIQAFSMILEVPYWIPIQILILGVIFVINAKPIMNGIFRVLKRHRP